MFDSKNILVTGSSGLVGSEFKKLFPDAIFVSSKDYNLTKEIDVQSLFLDYKPKCVVHLAARVGGILDNIKNPAIYFDDNVLMNTLMLKYSYLNSVERFVGVLSTCIYPDTVDVYPMQLEDLHKGPPTKTNFSYGYAKRSLAVQIDAYNSQYGTKYNYVVPCNLYGEHDKFDSGKSHFVTALLLKIKTAIKNGEGHISLFGDGTPLRQFMHAEDLAKSMHLMLLNDIYENINIATDENYSINEIAHKALQVTNNNHLKIEYVPNTPNGQYRKDVCTKKFKELFPNYKMISLGDGMKRVYESL